jgi:GNAT superfamily N-acetyltransferase
LAETESNSREWHFGILPILLGKAKYCTWKILSSRRFQRNGIGSLLFNELILLAAKHRAKRMQWQVLNWNEPAIRFYQK